VKVIDHILGLSAVNLHGGPEDENLLAQQNLLRQRHANILRAPNLPVEAGMTFIGGCAGSGKTRVLKALVAFAKLWGFEKAVCLCAHTGVAASLLGANTSSSQLRFGLGMKPFKLKQSDIEEMQPVAVIVIDECSMISDAMLVAIERQLRKFRARTPQAALFMGGYHLCLCGDMYQLPPINSKSLAAHQYPPWSEGTYMFRKRVMESVILTESVTTGWRPPCPYSTHASLGQIFLRPPIVKKCISQTKTVST
jgi:hypothetical protein